MMRILNLAKAATCSHLKSHLSSLEQPLVATCPGALFIAALCGVTAGALLGSARAVVAVAASGLWSGNDWSLEPTAMYIAWTPASRCKWLLGASGCKWLLFWKSKKSLCAQWNILLLQGKWLQVAASRCWEQAAPSGCKLLLKRLQVAASGSQKNTSCVLNEKILHAKAFTHRRFYTETLLHTDAFAHRSFYTRKLLRTKCFFTHRHCYTQTLLHTEAFAHQRFYTQKLLHTDAFTHNHFLTHRLLHPNFASCDRVAADTKKSQFYISFWHYTGTGQRGLEQAGIRLELH